MDMSNVWPTDADWKRIKRLEYKMILYLFSSTLLDRQEAAKKKESKEIQKMNAAQCGL